MKLLAIDCCIRGELSSTRRLLKRFLEKFGGGYQLQRLSLTDEGLRPMDHDELALRNRLLGEGRYDNELFRYARDFRDADKIIIAAPYWDCSFPSLLKVYLEKVAVAGITFGYEDEKPVGYCRAGRVVYLSTAGGFVSGPHFGAEYLRSFASMLGINSVSGYYIEGLDISPAKREQLLEEGITRILSAASL